jgi:hypothetical protein
LSAAGAQASIAFSTTDGGIRFKTLSAGSSASINASGTAVSTLGFDTELHHGLDANVLGLAGQSASGSGNVARLASVTVSELAAIASAAGGDPIFQIRPLGNVAQIATVGIGSSTTLQVSGPVSAALGFDTTVHLGDDAAGTIGAIRLDAIDAGTYGNRLSARAAPPTNAQPNDFNLVICEDGTEIETFENLSRDSSSPRFVETIVNASSAGSTRVRATNLPNSDGVPPIPGTYALAGGTNGALTDADYIGDAAAKTGLHALDTVSDLSLLMVPGRATPPVHSAMLAYCEQAREGNVFAVLDPPAGASANDMVTYVTTTASLENASEYGALYWPHVKVQNPDSSVYGAGNRVTVPPSGLVAGMFARKDTERAGGIYAEPKGPAAGRLSGVVALESLDALDKRKRDRVAEHRVNALASGPLLSFYADGSATLRGDGELSSIAERRGAMYIERGLKAAAAFARDKINTRELRTQVRQAITSFLVTQMNNGAFRSRSSSTAFSVDVSDALNPPPVVFAGYIIARVGLAMERAGVFTMLTLELPTMASWVKP